MSEQKMTQDLEKLVQAFSASLLAKLIESEHKYGWRGGWTKKDWASDLRAEIRKHVEKGDPRDVAAYCAFAWFHGWSLSNEQDPIIPTDVIGDCVDGRMP